jgi:hypothetical protein
MSVMSREGRVRQDSLGDGKHGEDVTPESTLNIVELVCQLDRHLKKQEMYINLGDRLGHDLLGSIVDQDIQSSVLSNML